MWRANEIRLNSSHYMKLEQLNEIKLNMQNFGREISQFEQVKTATICTITISCSSSSRSLMISQMQIFQLDR